MKIYLLNPPYYPHFIRSARWQDTGRGGTLYYPIWLAYAAGVLEQQHDVRLVDAPAWGWNKEKVISDVQEYKPDIVVIETSFPSLNNDLDVAKDIKSAWDAKIIAVGPPCSQFAEEILQHSEIDVACRLEYEYTLLEMADSFEKNAPLDSIRGISFKLDDRIIHNPLREWTTQAELDKMPFVSKVYKKHLNIKDYFLGSSLYPEVQIFTGRGCPNLCTFCSWPETLTGRKYRVRSINNVLDELEWIETNLPEVKEVFFEDDTFTINNSRVIRFCEGYKQRGLKIAWACNARATLDYETMKNMREAGCRLVIVGYESGDDNILKNIKKGIKTSQIKEFAKNAKKAGLLVHGDFVIGLPGETKETIRKTNKLINEIKPDILQISVASPFPGTEFYRWAKENGYLITDDPNEYLDEKGHQKSIINYPWLSADEINRTVDMMLKNYYLSISYIPIALKQILRKNGSYEFKRLWYSAKVFLGYIK
jgi:radical SAM superfamily enzyme YgiQ (UPF0313 family)